MNFRIEWKEDSYDCEDCGGSYAYGAIVYLDDKVFIDMSPVAHCYDIVNYDAADVYKAILEKLGYSMEEVVNEYS